MDHIDCLDKQIKACIHTALKYQKDNFSGACTYFSRKVACIFPEKYPEYQKFKQNGPFKGGMNGKRRVDAAGMNHINNNNSQGRKYNGMGIYDLSRY